MTTRRSAPAASTPWLKAPRMATSRPKRNSATAKEPTVRSVRTLRRKRLASEQGQELHCVEHPLVEVQRGVRPLGRARIVRHHEHRLAELAAPAAPAGPGSRRRSCGRGRPWARRRAGTSDRRRWRGRWPRAAAGRRRARAACGACGRRGRPRAAPSPRAAAARAFESGASSSGSSTLRKAESTGIRLYIWKMKPTWRARQRGELARRRGA